MARINNRKVLSGLLWRFAERCGAQGASFIVSIILARLLNPDIYGTISLITVFTTILQVFIDSGMANALIQKKDADEIDFSTVLFFNISVCCILFGLGVISSNQNVEKIIAHLKNDSPK